MIAAGFGFRKGASGGDIAAAFEAALAASAIEHGAIGMLATSSTKALEQGFVDGCRLLDIPSHSVDDVALQAASARTLTVSDRSIEATGTPSLAEAAALAAAGDGSALLGPRVATPVATCALARSARP